MHDLIGRAMAQRSTDLPAEMSPFAACLVPLLLALGWRGQARDVSEALPHRADDIDLIDLRNALLLLGYESMQVETTFGEIDPRLLPALWVPGPGRSEVILSAEDAGFRVFDGTTRQESVRKPSGRRGLAFHFTEARDQADGSSGGPQVHGRSWFRQIVHRFRPVIYHLLAISFVVNLLALLVPLFILVVFDRVIGSQSAVTLPYLLLGLGIIVAADLSLRVLRANLVGRVAGRLDYILGVESFARILSLSPRMTETATVASQMTRLRQFESVRDFFTGPLANAALELPFVVLFIFVLALLGGWIAVVPVGMIAVFGAFAWYWMPIMREAIAEASRTRGERENLLVEILSHRRAIKSSGADQIWRERFRLTSAAAVSSGFETARRTAVLQSVSQLLMILSGVAVLGMGTSFVLQGSMTLGALVASMALVWRVLAPIQSAFLAYSRLESVNIGVRQLNSLMRLSPERSGEHAALMTPVFSGSVGFERVSFRYSSETDPALLAVSFTVPAGEMLAITGSNGAGKSTVLKLIAGMYTPQAGSITIDGLDIRQLDPIELRRLVAYVPQSPSLFHGTITQNLRMADASASDDQLARACAEVGLLDAILRLPEGFNTRIADASIRQLPFGFSKRLVMARALVRDAPIMLLDEPGTALDEESDQVLVDLLGRIKGRTTVFMVSHRPSHIRLADRVLVMDKSIVRALGNPDEILEQLRRNA